MSNPYVGEIRMFGGSFAPAGWAFCDGALVPISENDTLFTLIGTTYGGDGQETFALPDLQGRFPVHAGSSHVLGEKAGTETVTLTVNQIPMHNHVPQCSNANGNSTSPSNTIWAAFPDATFYSDTVGGGSQLNPGALTSTGGNQPHDNMMPYLVVTFIISLFGIFPSQS